MQFKIKEMKGKPDCEWFYKHDSPGALRRQFCKRLWASIPRKDRDEGMAVPLCAQECGIRMASLSAGETDILDPNRRQWWSQHSSQGARIRLQKPKGITVRARDAILWWKETRGIKHYGWGCLSGDLRWGVSPLWTASPHLNSKLLRLNWLFRRDSTEAVGTGAALGAMEGPSGGTLTLSFSSAREAPFLSLLQMIGLCKTSLKEKFPN